MRFSMKEVKKSKEEIIEKSTEESITDTIEEPIQKQQEVVLEETEENVTEEEKETKTEEGKEKVLERATEEAIEEDITKKVEENEETETVKEADTIENRETEEETIEKEKTEEETIEKEKTEEETKQAIEETAATEEKGKQPNRKAFKIGIAVAAIVLLTYLGGVIYYHNRFLANTTINQVDCSGKTVKRSSSLVEPNVKDFVITLLERNQKKEYIKPDTIDLKVVYDVRVKDIKKKQSVWLWPIHLFKKDSFQMKTSFVYTEEKLEKQLGQLECLKEENQIQPENAKVVYNKQTNQYELKPEQEGTAVNKDKLKAAILKGLQTMSVQIDMDGESCYEKAEYLSDSKPVQKALKTAQKYGDVVIEYKIGEDTERLDSSIFHTWIKISSEYKVTLSRNKAAKYVYNLAQKYNTYGQKRVFQTSYNKKKTTIEGGDYGWEIDQDQEVKQLIKLLKRGKSVKREPLYLRTAWYYKKGNDIGKTYVEINLTTQHLFFYVNGKKILESDVVTGKPDGVHNTPPGVYDITYCERNAVLNGPGYSTPVSYWMPFNGDIGLHDATWQTSFGGTRYYTHGSHGCVNLPLNIAAQIFEYAQTGMPVVCYFMEVKEKKPETTTKKPETETTTKKPETTTKETDPEETTTKKDKKEETTTKKPKKEKEQETTKAEN